MVSMLAAPLLYAQPAYADDLLSLTATSTPGEGSLDIAMVPSPDPADNVGSFVATADDGGSAPDNSCTSTAAAKACTIIGLKAGTQYTVTVLARDPGDTTSVGTKVIAKSANTTPDELLMPAAATATATGVSGQINAGWTAAANPTGGVANFTATAYLGGVATSKSCTSASAVATSCKIDGLTNGTEYTVGVVANGINSSGGSDPKMTVGATPTIAPVAPSNVVAITTGAAAPHSVLVTWDHPASDENIASYTVTGYDADGTEPADGAFTCTTNAPDATHPAPNACAIAAPGATDLTTNQTYYFKVVATNASGGASAAGTSNMLTPTVVPDTPPNTATAVGGSSKATVTWEEPASTVNVDSYMVVARAGGVLTGHKCTSTTLTCVVTGLTNGTAYTFDIQAVNSTGGGTGSVVESTSAVTPVEAAVPGVPTGVTLTAGVSQLAVNWAAATTNPAPAIGFTATASPGGATCSTASAATTTCTITGLTAGTSYTVTVVARGADGDSAASAASTAAVPLSPSSGSTVSNANGQLQIFVRGTNDHLYTSIRATDGTWGVAVDLGYPVISAPTVVRNANGRLQVFVLGFDHAVWHRQQTAPNSTDWSAWARVGATVWTSNFAIEANADGKLQMFGRDAAGNVRTAIQTTAGEVGWTELTGLGGLVFSDPSVANSGGKLEVFAVGYDGKLWHRMQSAPNSTEWSAWARVGGSLTSML
jgi:large repetitive protein